MADIIITPLAGKIDFFTNKGDNTPINGVKLVGSNLVFYGPISASSILTNGGGRYVTTTSPTINYVPKFNSNSSIANSLIFDNGTNVGIGTNKPSASLQVISSTSGTTLLRADGTSGTLFSVVDDLTDSLMSVNNSAGLPVFEVFADDRIVAGQYGVNDFVLTNNKVGIGTNNPIGKLHVTGSTSTPAGIFLGDVGIGTTAPTSQANYRFLQVNGPTSAIIETTVGGSRIGGFDSTSNTLYVGTIGSYPIVFRTAVNEKMRIAADGNVGIGTTTPAYKLDINGITRFQNIIRLKNDGWNLTDEGQVRFYFDTSGRTYFGSGNGYEWRSVADAALMVLTNAGNVGIGTTSPTSKLFVSAGTLASSQRAAYISADITTNTTVYTHTLNLIDSSADANTTSLALGTYSHVVFRNRAVTAGSAGGILDIYTRGVSTDPTVKMTITDVGNVGIGTTAPTAKLQIGTNSVSGVSDNSINARIGQANAAGIVYGLSLANTAVATVSNQSALSFIVAGDYSATGIVSAILRNTSTAATDLVFTTYNSGLSERMRIQYDGNVGIGTTSPAYKLDVNGTFNVSGTSTLAGVSITGTINSSATEAIRINNNNGYISFYNSAGNTRTGYLQGNTGNSVILAAENSSAILFSVGGSEIARIATSGNVGIGTTAPARKLDISGSAIRSFSAGGGGEPGFIVDYPSSNGYGAFFVHVNGTRRWRIGSVGDTNVQPALNFWQEGTGSRMYINNLGNVGIGTSGPAGQLDVYSSGGSSGYVRSSVSAIRLLAYGDGSNWIQSGTGTGTSAADLIFSNMTGTSQWMRIQGSTGNVGIGTTSPGAKLAIIGNRLTDPNNDAQSREIYYAVSRTVAAAAGSTTLLGYLTPTSRSDNAVIEIYHHDCGTIEYIRFVMNSAYYSGATTDWVQLPTISNISYSGNFNGCTVDARLASTGANIELRLRSNGGACADMAVFVSIKTNCLFTSQTTTGTGGTVSGILCNNGYDFPVGANRFEGTRNRGLYIINSGNVGINTQSPSAMLHVSGSTAGDEVFVGTISDNQIVGGRTGGSFGIATKTASNGNLILTANANIYLRSGGSNDRVFVKSDGNVGIGTTTVPSPLTIYNNADVWHFRLGSSTGELRFGGATNNGAVIQAYTPAGVVRDLYIQRDGGNVGIGTNSPVALLDLYSAASRIKFHRGASYDMSFGMHDSTYSALSIKNASDASTLVYFQYDGNVGINTSSPAAKLDVNGSAIIRGALSSDSSRTTTYTTLTGAANDWFPLFTVGDSTDATVICNIKTFAHSSVTFTAARGYGPSQTHVITILNSQQNANGGYANITGVRIRQSGTVEIQLSWASGPAVDISAQLIGTYYTPTFVASLATTTAVDTIVDTISLQSGLIRTKRNMVADGYITGGSVGAGISAPTSILHVRASAPGGTGTAPTGTNVLIDSDSSNYITFRNTADNGTYAGLAFLDNNVGGYIVFRNYTGNVLNGSDSMIYGTYQDHIFQNSSSETINGKTETMRIKSNGNVGIGTNAPTYRLHLSGSMLITGVGSGFSTPGSEAGYRLKFYDNGGVNNDTGIGLDGAGLGSEAMWFNALQGFYWNFGTNGEKMRLTSVGNLGIGTSVPSATLTVIATNNTGSRIQLGTATTNTFMDANKVNDFMILTAPFNSNPASVANAGAKWGIKMNGSVDTINTKAKSAAIYAVSEDTIAGYNRQVGLALHTSGFDLENTERVRISNTGNVGIGTTNPLQVLHINGSILLDGVTNGYTQGATRAIGYGSNSGGTSTNGFSGMDIQSVSVVGNYSQNVRFWTHHYGQGSGGTPRMVIQYDGNIGIGTTVPTQKLEVAGYIMAGEGSYRTNIYGSNGGAWIGFGDTTSLNSLGRIGAYGSLFNINSVNGDTSFQYNGSEKMRITTGGNVGIGTTTVPTKFTTYVGSGAISGTNDAIRLQVSSYNNAGRNTIVWAQDTGNLVLGRYGLEWNSSNSQMNFVWRDIYNNGAGSTELMRLTGGGSLGIGTTTPSALLHAVSSTAGATLLRADGTSGTLFSVVDDLTDSLMSVNNSAGLPVFEVFADDRIVAGQYGVSDFVITNNKVGIGTNNPVAKLHISSSFTTLAAAFIGNVGIGTTTVAAKLVVLGEVQVQSNSAYTTHLNYADSGINFITMANSGYTDFRGSSNGVTTMRVKGDGNVGIGNGSPVYKLDVAGGDINFASTSVLRIGTVAVLNESSNANDIYANIRVIRNMSSVTQDGMYVNYNSTGGVTSHLRFFANGTSERMRIQANDGFVGIGTTSAVGRLDVYDSTDAGHVFFVRNASTGTSAYSAIVLRRNGDANGIVLFTNSSNRTTDGGAGNSTIRTDNGNLLLGAGGTTYHVLNTVGSVGIGTTIPAQRLDVRGYIVSDVNSNAVEGGFYLGGSGHGLRRVAATNDVYLYTTSGTLYIGTTGNTSQQLTLLNNGNLGIGTTAPSRILDVNGSARIRTLSTTSDVNFVVADSSGNLAVRTTGTVRAWIHFDGTGTPTSNANFNVSSITDNGVGDYTINFTTSMGDAFYVVSGTATYDYENPGQSINNMFIAVPRRPTAQQATSCRISTPGSDNNVYDCKYVRVEFVK